MTDFNDFIDYLENVIGNAISNIPNGEGIADHVHETMQFVMDQVTNSEFELDDEHKAKLIEQLADAMNLSQDEVSEQLGTISKVGSSSFKDSTMDDVTDLDTKKLWNGDFTSNPPCWIVCENATGHAYKRMTCGYNN